MIVSFESPNNDENWTPSSLANLIAKRQCTGEDVKSLIAPLPLPIESNADDDSTNQSCTACHLSPSKKPKNHLRANRQALKEKQQQNKLQKEARQTNEKLKQQQLEMKKQKLYGKVRSRVSSSFSSPSEQSCCESAEVQSINRGVSPLSVSTTSDNDSNCHIAFGRTVPIHAQTSHHRPNINNSCAESAVSSSSTNSRRHKSFGKVPSYITRRRAKIAEFEEEQRRRDEMAPPEPGLVLLKESERLKTLDILTANEKVCLYELANIPFAMNPRRAGKLREAITLRLNDIRMQREIFSKEKVFVAQDD